MPQLGQILSPSVETANGDSAGDASARSTSTRARIRMPAPTATRIATPSSSR